MTKKTVGVDVHFPMDANPVEKILETHKGPMWEFTPEDKMTKDQALRVKMSFGKHKGKTLGLVYAEDESYIDWLIENIDPLKFPETYEAVLTISRDDG